MKYSVILTGIPNFNEVISCVFEPSNRQSHLVGLHSKNFRIRFKNMEKHSYPKRQITLYRRMSNTQLDDTNRRAVWSVTGDGNFKTVEHAAMDYFSSDGRFTSHDVSELMEILLTLQVIAANKLSKADTKRILKNPRISQNISETIPFNLPSSFERFPEIDVRFYLSKDTRLRNQIFQKFPSLNENFSERDLTKAIIEGVGNNFLDFSSYKDAVNSYIRSLNFQLSSNVPWHTLHIDLSLLTYFHYSHRTDKDVRLGQRRYASRPSGREDMQLLFENTHFATIADIEKLLPTALPIFFKNWQDEKINGVGYGSKKYHGRVSEIRKLDELSEIKFWGYLVHNARSFQEVVSAIVELYQSVSPKMWLNLAEKHWSRTGDFIYTTGVPDLIVWGRNEFELVEIKSPSDSLQKSQIDYFETVLDPLNLNYSVAHINVK